MNDDEIEFSVIGSVLIQVAIIISSVLPILIAFCCMCCVAHRNHKQDKNIKHIVEKQRKKVEMLKKDRNHVSASNFTANYAYAVPTQ